MRKFKIPKGTKIWRSKEFATKQMWASKAKETKKVEWEFLTTTRTAVFDEEDVLHTLENGAAYIFNLPVTAWPYCMIYAEDLKIFSWTKN